MTEGIDFMMSPVQAGDDVTEGLRPLDLPFLQASRPSLTRAVGSLVSQLRAHASLIPTGRFTALRRRVETIAPPPRATTNLAESRRALDPRICPRAYLSLCCSATGRPNRSPRRRE